MKNPFSAREIFIKIPQLHRLPKEERNSLLTQKMHLPNEQINYTEAGQPYLKQPGDFSLSHKNDFIFATFNPDPRHHIGCDLECQQSSEDFSFDVFYGRLPPQERLFADSCNDELSWKRNLLSLFVCKESLYKAGADLTNRNGHLHIRNQLQNTSEFEYRVHGATRAKIEIRFKNDYLLGLCLLERAL